jgi:cytochrome c oxidase assembly factor CtaG
MPTLIRTLMAVLVAVPAMAHGGAGHDSGAVWTFDPWVVVPLATLAILYVVGSLKRTERSCLPRQMRWRSLLFWGGILTLAGALISPLHWLGEHLLSFHMIEHEIVMAVAAPLVVLARPIGTLLWGLPRPARRAAGSLMRAPAVLGLWRRCTGATIAAVIHGIAIWGWHLPILFDAALATTTVHRLQHLSFFVTAIVFWWAVVWKTDYGAAAWTLFLTMVHTSVLGALMALAPRVLYVAQTQTATAWGMTPLEDQQLAGLIMWVPAGIVYAGAAMAMLALWIGTSSQERRHNA